MVIVDTDVLVAHLRGFPPARDWLRAQRLHGPLSISAITVAELVGGMRSEERSEVGALLASLRVVPVTDEIARRAGAFRRTYRRSHSGIGTTDYLIAATAVLHGAEPATLNIKHFPMFPGLARPFELSEA